MFSARVDGCWYYAILSLYFAILWTNFFFSTCCSLGQSNLRHVGGSLGGPFRPPAAPHGQTMADAKIYFNFVLFENNKKIKNMLMGVDMTPTLTLLDLDFGGDFGHGRAIERVCVLKGEYIKSAWRSCKNCLLYYSHKLNTRTKHPKYSQ